MPNAIVPEDQAPLLVSSELDRQQFAVWENLKGLCKVLHFDVFGPWLREHGVIEDYEYEEAESEVTNKRKILTLMKTLVNKNNFWEILLEFLNEHSIPVLTLENSSTNATESELEDFRRNRLQFLTVGVGPLERIGNEISGSRLKRWHKMAISMGLAVAMVIVAVPMTIFAVAKYQQVHPPYVPTKPVLVNACVAGAVDSNYSSRSFSRVRFPCTDNGTDICPCSSHYCKSNDAVHGGYCECQFGGGVCASNGDCCNYMCRDGMCQKYGGGQAAVCNTRDISPEVLSGCKKGYACISYFTSPSDPEGKYRGFCNATGTKNEIW